MAVDFDPAREGRITFARITELKLEPVRGHFDVDHLREVHRRIFQDLGHHAPGDFRPPAPGHVKSRALESTRFRYEVPYALRPEVDRRLGVVLKAADGGEALRGLAPSSFAARMATLYSDLDHLHPFREGNSRTLRSFTEQLARQAGYALDWGTTNANAVTRDNLYMARDFAVIQRSYPGIATRDPADFTDRAEYSAYLTLGEIQKADRLSEILRQSVDRGITTRPATLGTAELRQELDLLLPAAHHQARFDEERARVAAARNPALQPLHAEAIKRQAWLEGRKGPLVALASAEAVGIAQVALTFTPGERAMERVVAIGKGIAAAERDHQRSMGGGMARGARPPGDRDR